MKRATYGFSTAILLDGISIHALVKRATKLRWYKYHFIGISIHALVKRATDYIFTNNIWSAFQSTPS